jgi:hypothetical protein
VRLTLRCRLERTHESIRHTGACADVKRIARVDEDDSVRVVNASDWRLGGGCCGFDSRGNDRQSRCVRGLLNHGSSRIGR